MDVEPHAIRVLITGFGPFHKFNENPSWMSVKPLHNTVLYTDPPVDLVMQDDQAIITDDMEEPPRPQPIHITALEVPMSYQAVLAITPGLHARPPILPLSNDPDYVFPPPPPNGYDFMFHVGLAGRGPLRLEKLAHKNGYRMKDADGQYAPAVLLPKDVSRDDALEDGRMQQFLGMMAQLSQPHGSTVGEGVSDGVEIPPNRGFGKGYENFPDEIHTEIDVAKLIQHMKEAGIESAYSSMDAGHYLSDFIFYCSLAEAKRMSSRQEKFKDRGSPTKSAPVLSMHCPPVDQPLGTEEVTEAIKRVVLWVCSRLHQ
ncbi:peptidase C15 pyroglutamyl peptidase I-like protein [Laetiporus sulphureus 93-53]|uniref:Peptidase C15 pyroglutamyl peptidase I-like protein n=1 Tax=Laetiporus sulphureus 93-53 TaxID=1314785 RepID=A0A165GZV1_9APHY|nr:peptidase C15 pyroglutamyl peptidase I-like protein [Laetiporus sulphureus 93-53]KZT11055.1 peptidase C15 pyroglutamyl peptidase I-like protein [Laetiporus sulphureus 93-53]